MRCVPIFIKPISAEFVQAWILLEKQGADFISMDSVDEAKTFAEESGLALTNIHEHEDTLFMIVDAEKTKLDEFYSWSDTSLKSDVWRPFVWYIPKDTENDLHINICHMNSPFGEVLNTYFKRYHV